MPPICIYHANCMDGFGAAWVVWKYFGGEVGMHAAGYGSPPPEVGGRDVVIVDFSYKREVLEALAKEARSVLVLDHHKTAQEDLAGVAELFKWGERAWGRLGFRAHRLASSMTGEGDSRERGL